VIVDAVGFDFDHTLGVDRHLERDVGIELLGEHGAPAVDAALDAYRRGAAPLDAALLAAGIEPDEFRAAVLARAPDYIQASPGVPEVFAALRRAGVPIAILSNGWSPLQQVKAQLVGFDGPVLVSDDIGVRKPAREAFVLLERCLAVPAERIAYVGDDPIADVGGALGSGLRAIWYDACGASYPQDAREPTARIGALADILRFVQGPS
jgi:HAD superfamily hydrolase (TIGR01549 family)